MDENKLKSNGAHLPTGSGDLVDDVHEDDILVVGVRAHLLPLRVLAEADIVAEEGMADAEVGEKWTPFLVC